jgi:hypothetical protein
LQKTARQLRATTTQNETCTKVLLLGSLSDVNTF